MTRQARLLAQAERYPVSPGPSIREMIQEDLDDAVDELMEMKNTTTRSDPKFPEARGYAHGLARALAIMINPYDFEQALVTVRTEAMERWEERESETIMEAARVRMRSLPPGNHIVTRVELAIASGDEAGARETAIRQVRKVGDLGESVAGSREP